MANPVKYQVVDSHTQYVVGIYSSLRRAANKVDQLDLEYGASRYFYRRFEEPSPVLTTLYNAGENISVTISVDKKADEQYRFVVTTIDHGNGATEVKFRCESLLSAFSFAKLCILAQSSAVAPEKDKFDITVG